MPIKKGTTAAATSVAKPAAKKAVKKVAKKAAKKTVKKSTAAAASPVAAPSPARKSAAKTAAVSTTKAVAKKAASKTAAKKAASTKARSRARIDDSQPDDDEPAPAGGTTLVIVESPAKAKTIGKYLGKGFTVKATVGHVRDLPAKKLGIDIEHGFAPDYVTIEGKEDILTELKRVAKGAREIFIATDPDREGEAIGWHVEQYFTQPPRYAVTAPIRRVMFHEITKDKVKESMANPMDIDNKKVDAQQARRVLDRLVGYKASPVLWKTVKKGLSAGRVQTVALRIIVEREREIRAFTPVEYWSIAADLQKGTQPFTAKLHQIDGSKPEIPTGDEAERILADLKGRTQFTVTEVKRREKRKNPAAPFTTSTLQQEAAKKLGFGSKRTMRLAQDLYEGIDLGGEEGAVGLITYMRTDSLARLRERRWLRRAIRSSASTARRTSPAGSCSSYRAAARRNAQDAHEGVRPTDPARRPEIGSQVPHGRPVQAVSAHLAALHGVADGAGRLRHDHGRLRHPDAGARVPVPRHGLRDQVRRASSRSIARRARRATARRSKTSRRCRTSRWTSRCRSRRSRRRSTSPSRRRASPKRRWSRSSSGSGIGRPSTYASIISVLADRRYVSLEQRRFFPTPLGETVEKVMVKKFPDIFNVQFTAQMEGELDKIADGELGWVRALTDFWTPFQATLNDNDLDVLIGEAYDLSALATEKCPDCGGKLVAKGGFFGPFVACENHPKACKYTRPIKGEKKPAELTKYMCQECGEPMVVRHGRSGDFLGCSKFPKCRGTRSMPTGVKCPKDGGEIAERRSKKRGKAFYGCENYPNCDFVVWDKPVAETCPECGYVGAEAKSNKTRGAFRKCLKCANEWDVPSPDEAELVAEVA